MRILSVVPNSAATERIFSKMGIVHSKLRSRLHPGKVRKTVLIAEDIARKWPRPVHRSRKRKFGDVCGDNSEQPDETVEHDQEVEEAAATSFTTVTDNLHQEAAESEASDELDSVTGGSIPLNSRDRFKLRYLFDFASGESVFQYTSQLWKRGQEGLSVEREYHNVVYTGSQDGTVVTED
ncbi:hypothetical protein QCA50_007228 [Cerrena zonata]|uniref:HAT C-terminal dimerisation domain-containing protein n=1 Tax=Cerrena zonata TaxID=2478898 RepID=A0AAW0G7X1_9APHY